MDLSVDVIVVVVAVRRGAADELAGRIRPRVNPLTRIPLKAEMHGTNCCWTCGATIFESVDLEASILWFRHVRVGTGIWVPRV